MILALALAGAADVSHVDASLELDARLLDVAFLDLDGDGREELATVVYSPETGRREWHLRHFTADGRLPSAPDQIVPILEDVIVYGYADVRPEPGRELLFFTKSGVYSLSLAKKGLRGNIARLVETRLIYDVPDPGSLPRWRYVLPGEHGDTLLLPAPDAYEFWRHASEADGGYELATSFRARVADDTPPEEADSELEDRTQEVEDEELRERRERDREKRRELGVRLGFDTDASLFIDETATVFTPSLLRAGRRLPAPAIADVDGDGDEDLVLERSGSLHVYLGADGTFPQVPTRIETFPEYLRKKGVDRSLRLLDLDGDGDVDLLAILEGESDGLENAQVDVLALLNDGERLLPETPSQLLRFDAAEIRIEPSDVDGDGRTDLVVRKFEMPGLLKAATNLEFKLTMLIYLGDGKGTFDRKPLLKEEDVYGPDTVQEALKLRRFSVDCSGDGIADLVEIDFKGRIAVRRLVKESGFFSGESWKLEGTPWRRFDVRGSVQDLTVRDVNGDGIGDIVSAGSRRLTILLSRRSGR